MLIFRPCSYSDYVLSFQFPQETQLLLTNRATRSEVSQGHQTWSIPYVKYGFLLVCYSNFILEWTLTRVFEIFDFKNAVTLQTGLGSVKVIENITIR